MDDWSDGVHCSMMPAKQVCKFGIIRPQLQRKQYSKPRNIRFDHISVEPGLSYLDVRAIIQDQHGILYV